MAEIRRPKRKSPWTLALMIAAVAAILAVMVLWNPEGEKPAAGQDDETAQIENTTIAKAGTEAPDFTVTMLDGSTVTLSALRGKVVLLTFWATWCPPCREELSHAQAGIVDRFAGQEFVWLPVSRGEERATVEEFIADKGYTFPVGLDSDQAIYDSYAERFVPRNFLIDRDGRVVAATAGYSEEEFSAMQQLIETTIKK